MSSVDPGLEQIADKAVDLLVGRISGTAPADTHEEFVTDYKIITPPAEAERLEGKESCPKPDEGKGPSGSLMPPFTR